MNVTELARQLKIHPVKLLQVLPEFGFDIGARAVKVDDRVAQQIQRQWRQIKFVLERREKEEKEKEREKEKAARQASGVTVALPLKLTVRELADRLGLPVNKLIVELMKNGILAGQNENIDRDTATIIAQDLGFTVSEAVASATETETSSATSKHLAALETALATDATTARPPVIVVMGHVDHGKTKLLDAIREANVVATEAGGITQHIGAYQTIWTNPKTKEQSPLTFIDTPGHEAFTVMRSRGAKVADIAVLVVAADDSVKPQTVEAINIIKAAKLPLVVAINKIDKDGADPQRVRSDLAQLGLQPEDWSGDVPMVEISAKEKRHINKLLDTLLVVAEVHGEAIKANPARPAAGTVIESHVDKGQGPVATILVQTGTLRINDPLVINGELYGKARALYDYRGSTLAVAPPATPARILGFKIAPQVGDILDVGQAGTAKPVDIKARRAALSGAEQHAPPVADEGESEAKRQSFNVLVKADTLGSLEAIVGSLERLKNEEIGVKIVGKGLGNLMADDVQRAGTSQARLYGFNVTTTPVAFEMIQKGNLEFRQFKVIYDLFDDVKSELQKRLQPELVTHELGNATVLALFRSDRKSMVVGCRVEAGKLFTDARVRVRRGSEVVGLGKLAELQSGKQSVKEVPSGSECGVKFEGKTTLEVGDILEAYREEEKEKKLVLS